jgi:hypothetical protein
VEVVAVDDRRHLHAGLTDALLPGLVVLIAGVPGDVVNRAGARDPALLARVVAVVQVARGALEPVLAGSELGEAERLGEERAVRLE